MHEELEHQQPDGSQNPLILLRGAARALFEQLGGAEQFIRGERAKLVERLAGSGSGFLRR
jgi:hypothetical protein